MPKKDQTITQEPLTRGYKKKARTKTHLIETALRLYAQEKNTDFALSKLAKEAGVSQGSIYNYFKNSQDILVATADYLSDELKQHVTNMSEDLVCGAQRVAAGVNLSLLSAQYNPDWAQAMIQVLQKSTDLRESVALNLREDLKVGKAQKVFTYESEDVAVALVVATTIGMVSNMLDRTLSAEQAPIMIKMLLIGLGVNKRKAATIIKNLP